MANEALRDRWEGMPTSVLSSPDSEPCPHCGENVMEYLGPDDVVGEVTTCPSCGREYLFDDAGEGNAILRALRSPADVAYLKWRTTP